MTLHDFGVKLTPIPTHNTFRHKSLKTSFQNDIKNYEPPPNPQEVGSNCNF